MLARQAWDTGIEPVKKPYYNMYITKEVRFLQLQAKINLIAAIN